MLVKAKRAGLPPGALVYTGEQQGDVRVTVMDYDGSRLTEREVTHVEECFAFKNRPTVTWINIDGLSDTALLAKLGKHYKLHPLLLEDILSTDQPPKLEDFDNHIFLIVKRLCFERKLHTEQVSIVLGEKFVLTFQERTSNLFKAIRDRLQGKKGRLRNLGADYLTYSLIDAIVDHYFVVLDELSGKIEHLEGELLNNPTQKTLKSIQHLKRQTLAIRRAVWPLREIIRSMERNEGRLVKRGTMIYLRDVYDHTIQVIDTIETFRDMLAGTLDIYLSSVSNRMNEVMKVLTIIATIFIPLTFITGVYGMNFLHMPEIGWRQGYFAVWGVMLFVGVLMLLYFKKRRWL